MGSNDNEHYFIDKNLRSFFKEKYSMYSGGKEENVWPLFIESLLKFIAQSKIEDSAIYSKNGYLIWKGEQNNNPLTIFEIRILDENRAFLTAFLNRLFEVFGQNMSDSDREATLGRASVEDDENGTYHFRGTSLVLEQFGKESDRISKSFFSIRVLALKDRFPALDKLGFINSVFSPSRKITGKNFPFLPSDYNPEERIRTDLDEKGIFILAGTPGQGKTTTIHAILSEYCSSLPKDRGGYPIATIESPVEIVSPEYFQFHISSHSSEAKNKSIEDMKKLITRFPYKAIFFGEISDTIEAKAFIEICKSGIPTFTTIHAGSSLLILDRFSDKVGDRGEAMTLLEESKRFACQQFAFLPDQNTVTKRNINKDEWEIAGDYLSNFRIDISNLYNKDETLVLSATNTSGVRYTAKRPVMESFRITKSIKEKLREGRKEQVLEEIIKTQHFLDIKGYMYLHFLEGEILFQDAKRVRGWKD